MEYLGKDIYKFTVDDEEPNCLRCDNKKCDSKRCGAKFGWNNYYRLGIIEEG